MSGAVQAGRMCHEWRTFGTLRSGLLVQKGAETGLGTLRIDRVTGRCAAAGDAPTKPREAGRTNLSKASAAAYTTLPEQPSEIVGRRATPSVCLRLLGRDRDGPATDTSIDG